MKNFLQPQRPNYVTVNLDSGKRVVLIHPYTQTKLLSINAWLIILAIIIIIMAIIPKEYTNELLRIVALLEFLHLTTIRDKIDAYEHCMNDIRNKSF